MVPKIHAKGSSFKGAAMYLLHDKDRATTDDRVEWTATRNLATNNPHAAWKVMAMTAMDQARLKANAGVRNTGRKSRDSVLHVSLAWHPDEAEGLTRDEMMRAAHGAIRALGAEDRQAMFVSHNDEEQPHLHLLINRVSPEDGRMLSSSKERLNLSRWAQAYELERGEALCEQRVINNAARDRGEYTRGEPDKPRHIFELEAGNDNQPEAKRIKAEQAKKDYALARRTRELRARHAEQFARLAEAHKQRRAELIGRARTELHRVATQVRAAFRDRWELRQHEHQAELRVFEQRERQLIGRVRNALRSIDLKGLLKVGDLREAVRDAYNTASSAGGRLEALRRDQASQDRSLQREQNAEIEATREGVRSALSRALAERRALFKAERASLLLTHDLERAHNRAEWKARTESRTVAWERSRFHGKHRRPERHQESDGTQTIERSGDADEIATAFKGMRERRRDQDRDRDPGDDHER